jgi:hypothetical protein
MAVEGEVKALTMDWLVGREAVVERPPHLAALEIPPLLLHLRVVMAVLTTVVVVAHLRLALMVTVLAVHKQEKVEMELLHL